MVNNRRPGPAALLLDNLASAATLSGGSWVGLDYLLEPSVVETQAICASGSPEDAWFDLTFPAAVKWDTLLISGGTLAARSRYRLTWYDGAGALLAGGDWLYSWPRVRARAERSYHDVNYWSGRPRAADLAGLPAQLLARPPLSPRCRRIRIEIDNLGQPLRLGHLFTASSFRPSWPHDWPVSLGGEMLSIVEVAPGGARLIDSRPAPRTKTVSFRELSDDEAMLLHEAGQRLGLSGTLAMVEDINSPRHWPRRTWLATLADGKIDVEQAGLDRWSATIKLVEVVG